MSARLRPTRSTSMTPPPSAGPGAGGAVIDRRHPRRARLVLLADADPRSVVQPAARRARSRRDALDRRVPRYRPAIRRRQFRLPQLRRARSALARRRLRRRRHRYHGDQDRARGLRPRRGLHLHRDHHQYRRVPVQRPRAVHRRHVLADRHRAVWPPITGIARPSAVHRPRPGSTSPALRPSRSRPASRKSSP